MGWSACPRADRRPLGESVARRDHTDHHEEVLLADSWPAGARSSAGVEALQRSDSTRSGKVRGVARFFKENSDFRRRWKLLGSSVFPQAKEQGDYNLKQPLSARMTINEPLCTLPQSPRNEANLIASRCAGVVGASRNRVLMKDSVPRVIRGSLSVRVAIFGTKDRRTLAKNSRRRRGSGNRSDVLGPNGWRTSIGLTDPFADENL